MTAPSQRIRGDESRDAVYYSLPLRFSSHHSLYSSPRFLVFLVAEIKFLNFGKCDRTRIYNNKYIISGDDSGSTCYFSPYKRHFDHLAGVAIIITITSDEVSIC